MADAMRNEAHGAQPIGGAMCPPRFHVVMPPAYRVPVFRNREARQALRMYVTRWSEAHGDCVEAIGFGPDHAHLLLIDRASCGIPELVRSLKTFTSRLMRRENADLIRHCLWGKRFWSRGYWYRRVEESEAARVRRYILYKQQSKHWKEEAVIKSPPPVGG